MADITIIIPVYNSEKTLKSCLDSIKNQEYKDFEVILVDDCSTDRSKHIIKEYCYKLISLNKNSGSGKARNIGAKYAITKFIAFVDSDCILPKTWLSRIMYNFDNDIAFVCGDYSESVGNSFLEKYAFYELVVRRKNLPRLVTSFPSNNFACYKDIFLKLKGLPERKGYVAEDLEFSLKAGKKYRILWDKEIKVKHHFHKKLRKYLKQQYKFARDTMFFYLNNLKLRKIRTYHEEKNKFVIFYTCLWVLSIFILPFYKTILYLSFPLLSILMLLDFNLLNFLYKKEGIWFSIKSMGVVMLRNISWTTGMVRGVFRFFV